MRVSGTDGAIMRLTPDGSRDPSFGTNGEVILSGAHQDSTVADIAQPADGSYLTLNGDPDDECDLVHHLSASGVADPTFGVGGWVNTTTDMFGPGVRSGIADRIVVQPDGSILLAGTINNGAPTYNDLWVARYTPSGVIDMGFGVNGQAATDLGGADDCAAAAMGPDGKLVVAGYATAASAAMTSASGADNAPLPFGLSHDGEGLVRLLCGRSPLLRGPHTYALTKIVVKRGHVPAKFLCRVNALTREATITIRVFKGKRVSLVIHVGPRNANHALAYGWRKKMTLARGAYVWKVYAVDQQHRTQSVAGWNKLVVT